MKSQGSGDATETRMLNINYLIPKQESEHASNYACDTQNLFCSGGR